MIVRDTPGCLNRFAVRLGCRLTEYDIEIFPSAALNPNLECFSMILILYWWKIMKFNQICDGVFEREITTAWNFISEGEKKFGS